MILMEMIHLVTEFKLQTLTPFSNKDQEDTIKGDTKIPFACQSSAHPHTYKSGQEELTSHATINVKADHPIVRTGCKKTSLSLLPALPPTIFPNLVQMKIPKGFPSSTHHFPQFNSNENSKGLSVFHPPFSPI